MNEYEAVKLNQNALFLSLSSSFALSCFSFSLAPFLSSLFSLVSLRRGEIVDVDSLWSRGMNERECVAFLRVRFPRLLSCQTLYTFTLSLSLSLSFFPSVCLLILSFFRPGARFSRSLRPLRRNSDARKIRLARIDRFSKGNRANECRKIALFTFNYLPVYPAINKITRLMKYVPVSARLISPVRFERFRHRDSAVRSPFVPRTPARLSLPGFANEFARN